MITSLEVTNFRGIEHLSVSGLGRVNLIIGKNNSGKTALVETAHVVAFPEDAADRLIFAQSNRLHNTDIGNFDEFWRPLFRSGDAERGFRMSGTRAPGGGFQLTMRRARGERVITGSHAHNPNSPLRTSAWTLEYELEERGQSKRFQVSRQPDGDVSFPEESEPASVGWWITSGAPELSGLIASLSILKQENRDSEVRDLLRKLDERIESLEILSPTGSQASIFVRIAGETKLLPFRMMGDGVQRCFDIALGFVLEEVFHLTIDEFENGLHHSVLEPVWKWLATLSASRQIQVFATTHSEECVQAACRAFTSLNDDGLRVIRLDRQEHQTTATVYDRNLVAAAERMGIEIRG